MSTDHPPSLAPTPTISEPVARLLRGEPSVWLRAPGLGHLPDELPLDQAELVDAQARLARFEPLLRTRFPADGWDGRIGSDLVDYPEPIHGATTVLVKCDHALPIAGSVKARGGVYEVLCHLEDLAIERGLWSPGQSMERLIDARSAKVFGEHRIVVASTGNLGFSAGVAARAFGLEAEIHMSRDAKAWKKGRLRGIGATVVEHAGDYADALVQARASAEAPRSYFIDDEHSRRLFVGYATAADELARQLAGRGLEVGADQPLIVYLPCGVGGAPGGITAGLKVLFGANVIAVFVEPIASACMFAALAAGAGTPVSVYDLGLNNDTEADGLAVPVASPLVLRSIGRNIDAVVAVTDQSMLDWVRRAWDEAGLRLEPSASSGFAAISHFLRHSAVAGLSEAAIAAATHVVWTTGGSLLPAAEFEALLKKGR